MRVVKSAGAVAKLRIWLLRLKMLSRQVVELAVCSDRTRLAVELVKEVLQNYLLKIGVWVAEPPAH